MTTNIRISRYDDAGGNMDMSSIESALEQDAIEEMTPDEREAKAYADSGTVPNKIAKEKADSFGIRKAFFDVWKPVDENKKGVWHLQKDADGNEFIVRADSE